MFVFLVYAWQPLVVAMLLETQTNWVPLVVWGAWRARWNLRRTGLNGVTLVFLVSSSTQSHAWAQVQRVNFWNRMILAWDGSFRPCLALWAGAHGCCAPKPWCVVVCESVAIEHGRFISVATVFKRSVAVLSLNMGCGGRGVTSNRSWVQTFSSTTGTRLRCVGVLEKEKEHLGWTMGAVREWKWRPRSTKKRTRRNKATIFAAPTHIQGTVRRSCRVSGLSWRPRLENDH